jgi:hypothetical protein
MLSPPDGMVGMLQANNGGVRHEDTATHGHTRSAEFLRLHRTLWKAPPCKPSLVNRIRGKEGQALYGTQTFSFDFRFPKSVSMVGTYVQTVQSDCPLPASMLHNDFPRRIAYYLTITLSRGAFASESRCDGLLIDRHVTSRNA